MCSAARGIVRNAKQKKAVPAKNSEAIFWRPRFTWPLRAGKRANANFACSEGFFCARRAAPSAGAAVLVPPAAVVVDFVPGARCFFCRCVAALFPACGCPPFFVWPALPACRLAVVGFVSGLQAACRFCAWPAPPGPACHLPAVRFVCTAFLSCFFSFLPHFCLSKIFSFVAQAATGLYFLPKRK